MAGKFRFNEVSCWSVGAPSPEIHEEENELGKTAIHRSLLDRYHQHGPCRDHTGSRSDWCICAPCHAGESPDFI